MILLFVSLLYFLQVLTNAATIDDGQLKMVILFNRHGERNMIHWTYKNDPYKNESYWPEGFSQLTKRGVEQQYALGAYLRQRYRNFLPTKYYYKDIYVMSSETERTISSAIALLEGLYPPTGSEPWNRIIRSQMVPIHTLPREIDPILGMRKYCCKYERLYQNLLVSPEIIEMNNLNNEMFKNLTILTGENVTTITQAERIHLSLEAVEVTGRKLPDWANQYYYKLKKIAGFCYSLWCYNQALARLKGGPFLYDIILRMKQRLYDDDSYKFLVYSAHESGLANILTAIGAFDEVIPPFSSHMLVELWQRGGKNYVQMTYNNTKVVKKIRVGDCGFYNCTLEEFEKALAPITVSLDNWEEECKECSD